MTDRHTNRPTDLVQGKTKNKMELICQNKRCNHEWNYGGSAKVYACCPICRFKIRINPTLKEETEIKQLEEQIRLMESKGGEDDEMDK